MPFVALSLIAAAASAQPSPAQPQFDPSLVLIDGHTPFTPPDHDLMRAQLHGEYQVRFQHQSDVPLTAPASDPGASSLGQKNALAHWFRLTPRFDFRDKVALIGQIDIPRGFMLGETTSYVGSARDAYAERNPIKIEPRWLYVEATTPYGLWRLGQQGSSWGMGILANDGTRPTLFGDYRHGSIVERLLFATKPFGKSVPLTVALGGDLVFRDRQANLVDGDHAFQGLLSIIYGSPTNQVGIYGVVRRQSRKQESFDVFTPYTESLNVGVGDIFAKFAAPVPGTPGFVFGELEAAIIHGSTNYIRTSESSARGQRENVRSYGGAARAGFVHTTTEGGNRWGNAALTLEWGYASGDANPNDGTQRRFTFESNHNVGLVLFQQAIAWSTARSAVLASDPALMNRPSPGLQYYPSDGAIFGATYLYPAVVVRPKPWLDLKGAMLLAQTTSDVVDPYRYGVLGQIAGWRGGDPKRHDLGMEFDLGFEARVALEYGMTLQLGAQGGILVPGHALDDASGNAMPNQGVAVGRFGLQY